MQHTVVLCVQLRAQCVHSFAAAATATATATAVAAAAAAVSELQLAHAGSGLDPANGVSPVLHALSVLLLR
jgi:hypothetical protein